MKSRNVILLIEDNEDHAELIIEALSEFHLQNDIIWKDTGEKGLDFLFQRGEHANDPDLIRPILVLLDIKLPGIDGLDVLKAIKEEPGTTDIPVVMLTTSQQESEILKSYEYHASSYIVKPMNFNEFMTAMENLNMYWQRYQFLPERERFRVGTVTIVVCEDNPDHRLLMLESLEDHIQGAEFLEAESGRECLEIVRSREPEILILDYRLGDLDGLEILVELKDILNRTAVLLVTSQGDEKIAVDAMKLGARDYLVKDTRLAFIDHLPISVNRALKQITTERDRVSAQKKLEESEHLNRTILNQMAEAVIFADKDDQILHLNDLACRILEKEYQNAQNILLTDESIIERFPELPGSLRCLREDAGLQFVESETILGGRILLFRFSPVRDDKGAYRGVILNMMDITNRRREEKEQMSAIHQTVTALAKAVEFRDPYTSGHAVNVAFIATRIAEILGWDAKRVMGLRLAGELHDIGKIAIPAEILTRPTRLTELEMAMLQEHPGNGYEILKDIKFPFPIADAVYQHHEFLDGSGYPRQLRADEIIDEAKILVIADVLDAITAHRPYRAGLGIDTAVEQLLRGRGIIYDSGMVDAAMDLINKAEKKPFWQIKIRARHEYSGLTITPSNVKSA